MGFSKQIPAGETVDIVGTCDEHFRAERLHIPVIKRVWEIFRTRPGRKEWSTRLISYTHPVVIVGFRVGEEEQFSGGEYPADVFSDSFNYLSTMPVVVPTIQFVLSVKNIGEKEIFFQSVLHGLVYPRDLFGDSHGRQG